MRDEASVKRLATLEAVALAPARLVYSVWIALAFLAVGVAALVLLALLPGVARRRAAARAAARAFLRLAGMPLRVKFLERLPPGQCVVVCNHASYLDGIVLAAALPPRFGFVVKREMAGVPLAGVVLRRLGSEFVERFDCVTHCFPIGLTSHQDGDKSGGFRFWHSEFAGKLTASPTEFQREDVDLFNRPLRRHIAM